MVDGAGSTVCALEGAVWITEEDQVKDIVLERGACYRLRNRVFCMQAGFDPDFAAVAPGAVLLGYAIEHAIGEGNEVFDFLRGEHMYKNQLANGTRESRYVTAFRPNARAWAASMGSPLSSRSPCHSEKSLNTASPGSG